MISGPKKATRAYPVAIRKTPAPTSSAIDVAA